MKKNKIFFSFYALVLMLVLVSGCTLTKQDVEPGAENMETETEGEGVVLGGKESEGEESINPAKMWVLESSPTYTFSGYDLIQEGEVLKTEEGSEYIFAFKSNYLGYGDRTAEEDSLVEQEVLHVIKLVVNEEGEVIKAVIDDVYDDLNSQMLQ